nr:reverse transcriptase domain-containing protein [Tanacetum cinerariifolium]
MDDELMWAVDHVVALTPGSAIAIPETANEFAIKGNHSTLVKGNQFDGRTKTSPHKRIHKFLKICDMFKYRDTKNEAVRLMIEIRAFSQQENESLTDVWHRMKEMLQNCHGLSEITQEVLNVATAGIFLYKTPTQAYQLLKDKVLLKLDWAKNQKTKSSLKKTIAFADEGSSNSNTDKIMARMDAMTLKLDAQYKQLQSNAKKTKPDLDDDDTSMSREEEAKFMQTFYAQYKQLQSNAKKTKPDLDDDDTPMSREEEAKFMQTFSGMPNYENFLKELIRNKHKIEQIYAAFLSDKSSAMIQNKVPPKLGDPESFLIRCNFNRTFSSNALVDLGASINLMPIDVIDEILEEYFDALLDEGSKILYSIEGTLLEEEIFTEFNEF